MTGYEPASAEEVRARRAATGRGMAQCKAEINEERRSAWLVASIETFRNEGDRDLLCDVLLELTRGPRP